MLSEMEKEGRTGIGKQREEISHEVGNKKLIFLLWMCVGEMNVMESVINE